VSGLPFLAQDLDFHDQLANAPGGLAKLGLQRIVLALLEARIHTGQGTLAPFLEPVYRLEEWREMASTGSPRNRRKTTSFFRLADHRFTSAPAPGALPVALRVPSTAPRHNLTNIRLIQHLQLRDATPRIGNAVPLSAA
jgi:hypothetical protein